MLKMIILVPVIMVCAAGGTVGLMKLIKKFLPNGVFPQNPIIVKFEKDVKKDDQE